MQFLKIKFFKYASIKRGGIPVPDIYAERFCMIIRWKTVRIAWRRANCHWHGKAGVFKGQKQLAGIQRIAHFYPQKSTRWHRPASTLSCNGAFVTPRRNIGYTSTKYPIHLNRYDITVWLTTDYAVINETWRCDSLSDEVWKGLRPGVIEHSSQA